MFWIISAIFTVIAMAFMWPALVRKDFMKDATREQNISIAKEQLADLEMSFEQNDIDKVNYLSSKEELERSLFNDLKESDFDSNDKPNKNSQSSSSKSIDTWLILLLVPLITVPVYFQLGNLNFTKQLDPKSAVLEVTNTAPNMPLKPDGTPDIEKVTERLKLEMESNPSDPKGWYMLGRAYMMIQRFPDAAESFDKSLALRPDTAETMLSLADALSMNNNGQLIGRPRELVTKALSIEPQNMTALWLSGMAASQEAEYIEAISHWRKVLPLLDDKPEEKAAVSGLIAEAESRLTPEMKKQIEVLAIKEEGDEVKLDDNDKSIKLNISLSGAFKDKVSPTDSVFIYAKAVNGPPMPLAAVRRQVKDFPLELVLNDEMAMMPDLKLSSFTSVIVGARISKTGQAVAQSGDLFDEKTDIKLGDSVTLEIDKIFQK